jgi:hypothetical protein
MEPKIRLYFTDSDYDSNLVEHTVLSGDSPIYLKAITHLHPESILVKVYLRHHPNEDAIIALFPTAIGDTLYEGKTASGRSLGLESYDRATAATALAGDSSKANIWIALPRILTSRDTVFIRSDSMKIKDDLKAFLIFYDDSSSNFISPPTLVDTVGYKYKSKWTANANQKSGLQHTYFKQFPNGPYYKWWNKTAGNCTYTFKSDSLYAVGGLLSILARGAIKPVPNINNSFSITTDTFLAHDTLRTDSIAAKRILIDQDPPNSIISPYFSADIVRAVAWKEGAGTLPEPGHPHSHDPWNHYWFDTHTPCENSDTNSTATGIMQFLRSNWEEIFNGTDSTAPAGDYYICSWDSLAWNWRKCIYNGEYIYFTVNFYHMYHPASNPQRNWDSLYFPANDYSPDKPNKEDLAAYGYHFGWPAMIGIKDSTSWVKNIMIDKYVNNVRKYKDTKPWNQ